MNSLSTLLASPRFWPRAAVWGGAIASTAMNLSSNWHAETVDGITTFIAPTAGGLHLPEMTKLIVSAAFPLLLIFAVESAARTSLRFSWRDSGSFAMPLGAIIVFAFSVGEVTRLLIGMGQPLPLALLFALAPDVLITAGTVVLMRERAHPDTVVDAPEQAPAAAPEQEDSHTRELPTVTAAPTVPAMPPASRPAREAPVAQEAPASQELPTVPREVAPAGAAPTRRQEQEATASGPAPENQEATGGRPANVRIGDAEALARIREYRNKNGGQLPSPNWMKQNLGMGAQRAERLLSNVNLPDSEIVDLRAVSSATG